MKSKNFKTKDAEDSLERKPSTNIIEKKCKVFICGLNYFSNKCTNKNKPMKNNKKNNLKALAQKHRDLRSRILLYCFIKK